MFKLYQNSLAKSVLKQASVSQHSSLSQADDICSPYARVKASHDYDKVKHQEHPYAHINQAGPSNTIHLINEEPSSQQQQQNSPTGIDDTDYGGIDGIIAGENEEHEIPAASAIAGRIAASQELPYMTPPIIQQPQQHFSGDSQDSSSKKIY